MAAIKCIFYSEFHPVAGPMITFQTPQDFPIREAFDAVHDLIITKPQLYNRLISVDVGGYRIVGCPKSIEDNRYARNAIIFNFVFVFNEEMNTAHYEPVIQKIGEAFRTYELENGFLSNESSKSIIPSILSQLHEQLNSGGISTVRIDDINTLCLKVTPILESPPIVHDYHVPVFTVMTPTEQHVQDLTMQEIMSHINGFNHVAKIADMSEVSQEIVKECIQHLVIYGFVKLLSIFQYCNVYVATSKLPLLLKDRQLQNKCLEFVAANKDVRPKLTDVFRLYCSLEAGLTVKDMCFRSDPTTLHIDERKLIQFGLMENLIHHLQKYPVLNGSEKSVPSGLQPLLQYLDGSYCYDQICCSLGISNSKLDELIDKCPDVVLCWK